VLPPDRRQRDCEREGKEQPAANRLRHAVERRLTVVTDASRLKERTIRMLEHALASAFKGFKGTCCNEYAQEGHFQNPQNRQNIQKQWPLENAFRLVKIVQIDSGNSTAGVST
jgi:hypothetical protein